MNGVAINRKNLAELQEQTHRLLIEQPEIYRELRDRLAAACRGDWTGIKWFSEQAMLSVFSLALTELGRAQIEVDERRAQSN